MKIIIERDGKQNVYTDLAVANIVLVTKDDKVVTINEMYCNVKQAIGASAALQKSCKKISRKIINTPGADKAIKSMIKMMLNSAYGAKPMQEELDDDIDITLS